MVAQSDDDISKNRIQTDHLKVVSIWDYNMHSIISLPILDNLKIRKPLRNKKTLKSLKHLKRDVDY